MPRRPLTEVRSIGGVCRHPPTLVIGLQRRGSGDPFSSDHFVRTDVLVREIFHVHIVDGYDLDPTYEPGRAIHVPHPCVGELDLEPRTARPFVLRELHVVGEIEAAFGLHRVSEHGQHVPVLLPQPELEVVFVPLDVLFAHGASSSWTGSSVSRAYSLKYVARSSA